ncbi:hypothetical protein [Neomegalonema sp.]|uniref:head-tail connector protein n=1 Tax=Neomegalonema sp. TaxID=2039713 RepID=UPI002634D291|nr:hypothetical protein [Neomegalonema sp.]MDD2870328.1 hypothetical protein [Neomegalonema sp.]
MRLIGPPPDPPLTVAQLKEHARLSPADDYEEATLQRILSGTTISVETGAHRPLSPRRAIFSIRRPFARWWFPVAPVRALTGARVARAGGGVEDLTGLTLVQGHDEPRLSAAGVVWPWLGPDDVIEIESEVGYEASAPEAAPLLTAVLMLAAWRVLQRETASEAPAKEVPFGLRSEIRQHRYLRPREMEL